MRRAMAGAAASTIAGVLALVAATAGATVVVGALLLVMGGLLADARRWLRLAGRSRVGAHSEDEVQRALAQLETEGWRLRHSLPWRGLGTSTRSRSLPPAWHSQSKQNQNPRGPARCSCARAGGMADPSPATMVQTRCAAGRVPCSTAWSRACRGRRAGGLDRPAYVCPRHLRRAARSSGLPPVTSPGCRG